MRSSYIKNNYADVFKAIVDTYVPRVCVELGVLDGYSAIAIAQGLKKNNAGHLDAYDLFDDYPFKHGSMKETQDEIDKAEVSDFVSLKKNDAYKVHEIYGDNSVGLLHVDISNTGETVRKAMENWDKKMALGGVILFEGGTEGRDQEAWMEKYGKEPIKLELESNPIIKSSYVFGTYPKWPGLTMLLKKR